MTTDGDKPKRQPAPDTTPSQHAKRTVEHVCPVCGAPLIGERCKVVCRSDTCRYRIIFNCSEF